MNIRTETVKAEGFTLAQMVWALLRRQPEGYVERVLGFNPGLAWLGPFLPVGTIINFPLDDIDPVQTSDVVYLWD